MAEDLTHTSGPGTAAVAEPTVTPLSPPGYELVEEIGHGGIGVVYRARNTALGRDVAVDRHQARAIDMPNTRSRLPSSRNSSWASARSTLTKISFMHGRLPVLFVSRQSGTAAAHSLGAAD
jgi:hypothetical protein